MLRCIKPVCSHTVASPVPIEICQHSCNTITLGSTQYTSAVTSKTEFKRTATVDSHCGGKGGGVKGSMAECK